LTTVDAWRLRGQWSRRRGTLGTAGRAHSEQPLTRKLNKGDLVVVKRPCELAVGDVVWLWNPPGWVSIASVEVRRHDTAMVRLSDTRTVEIFTKMIVW
jgi:hypothetical protein